MNPGTTPKSSVRTPRAASPASTTAKSRSPTSNTSTRPSANAATPASAGKNSVPVPARNIRLGSANPTAPTRAPAATPGTLSTTRGAIHNGHNRGASHPNTAPYNSTDSPTAPTISAARHPRTARHPTTTAAKTPGAPIQTSTPKNQGAPTAPAANPTATTPANALPTHRHRPTSTAPTTPRAINNTTAGYSGSV